MAGLYTAEIYQLLNERIEPLHIGAHKPDVFPYVAVCPRILRNALAGAVNECERCAELMGYISEETQFLLIYLLAVLMLEKRHLFGAVTAQTTQVDRHENTRHAKQQQDIKRFGPCGKIPGGAHVDFQDIWSALAVGDAVDIFYSQTVFAIPDLVEGDGAGRAVVHPLASVERIHVIAIGGIHEVRDGESECELALSRLQSQHRVSLGTAEIVEYVDILPRDGEALKRQLRPVQTVRRKISGSFLHGHKSVDTTEDKHRIGIESGPVAELGDVYTVVTAENAGALRARIETIQSVVRGYPQIAPTVFYDVVNGTVDKAVLKSYIQPLATGRHFHKSVPRPEPHHSVLMHDSEHIHHRV